MKISIDSLQKICVECMHAAWQVELLLGFEILQLLISEVVALIAPTYPKRSDITRLFCWALTLLCLWAL